MELKLFIHKYGVSWVSVVLFGIGYRLST